MTEPTAYLWVPALNEICPAYSEIARMVKMRSRQKYQYDAANRLVQVKKRQPGAWRPL
jgi:hypothetical protein